MPGTAGAGRPSTGGTVRWGVLGAGRIALEQMAPAIHLAGSSKLHAIATRTRAKAAPFLSFAPELIVYDRYQDLLDDPDVDAVYVALPNDMHVHWVTMALKAGKHVLCEKPIAMSASDIDGLVRLGRETGLVVAEAFMIVHHPQWKLVRDLLAKGEIGELRHVEAAFAFNIEGDPGDIVNQAERGGGALRDIGIYTIGSTIWATGMDPASITGADMTFENRIDTVARVSARFGTFSAHWLTTIRMHQRQHVLFYGSTGAIHVATPFNPIAFGPAAVELVRDGEPLRRFDFGDVNQYARQIEAFCRSVREGLDFPWPLEQSRRVQAVIDTLLDGT